ncbi:MAG: hypothetical protein AAFX92_05960 [Pseudomonadota bacterium]
MAGSLLIVSLSLGTAFGQPACGSEQPCPVSFPDGAGVDAGQYYVEEPPEWDGETPLPVIVWFHGYQGSGRAAVNNRGLVGAWTDAGYLFVAGDGRDNTWAHQGSPSRARNDTAYVRAVIEDVQDRYPTDPERIVAAGFSQGGSMVWSVACFVGAPFTHYAPISGAFWEPMPETCDAGPVTMRHTHGTSDRVVPMAGRPIGDRWRQADVLAGLDVLRALNACPAMADRDDLVVGSSTCEVWSSCANGALQLCLNDGGHGVPSGWSATTQAWIEATEISATN